MANQPECGAVDDEGRACERKGKHTLHRAPTEWSFVTWGEPDPVIRPSKKKKRGHTNAEMVQVIHGVLRLDETPSVNLSRTDDPSTSASSAKSVRTGSQKSLLLVEYSGATDGLTDEEAAEMAGLIDRPGCCWWHRSSDLRDEGKIVDTGEIRISPRTGEERMVCIITEEGRQALNLASTV